MPSSSPKRFPSPSGSGDELHPFPSDADTARCLSAGSRHFFLVNAPSATEASLMVTRMSRHLPAPSSEPPLLPSTRAQTLLGLESSLLPPQDYARLTRLSRSGRAPLGSGVEGLGSYVVELVMGDFKRSNGGEGITKSYRIVSVSPAELTLDADAWAPGEAFSESGLREAFRALAEQRELARSLPPHPARQSPSL